MPAHITIVYPFLDPRELSDEVLAGLVELFAGHERFEVSFRRCGRFPSVVYLEPEPQDSLRALTDAVFVRWPQAPPYGGLFDSPVPHLTVAKSTDQAALDDVEAALGRALPITTTIAGASLFVLQDGRWRATVELPFAS
jgi:2'-5' RNA ligase